MNFYELQYKYPLQNLINQTRACDTTASMLTGIHYQFGILLGREILGMQPSIYKTKQLSLIHYKIYHIMMRVDLLSSAFLGQDYILQKE